MPTAAARAAVPADRAPVEDDEVSRLHVRDAVPDRLDDARRLVAEEERELVVDPAVAVVEVRVAHAAGLDGDDGLARAGIGDQDGFESDRGALSAGNDAHNFLHGRHHIGLVKGEESIFDTPLVNRLGEPDPREAPGPRRDRVDRLQQTEEGPR